MSILYDFKNASRIVKFRIPWAELKAGTPIDTNGAEANDGNAFGIIAQNLDEHWNKLIRADGGYWADAEVIVAGYVDLAKAQASYGEYTDACKEALTDIVFVDGKLPSGGGEVEAVRIESEIDSSQEALTVVINPDSYSTLDYLKANRIGNAPVYLDIAFSAGFDITAALASSSIISDSAQYMFMAYMAAGGSVQEILVTVSESVDESGHIWVAQTTVIVPNAS